MNNSLQKHGPREAHKQLRLRIKSRGLDTVEVQVERQAGKLKFDFTGSKEQVVKAREILAAWT